MRKEALLVTGATGYVGGRLVPRLLEAGYRVTAMARSMAKLGCRPWSAHPNVTLVQGDVLDAESLQQAAYGCRAAFYLVHSMTAQKSGFAQADRTGAQNMAQSAEKAGLDQIVYLGGLGEVVPGNLSKHLISRHEVAKILQAGPVPLTYLRAAMILGSGSASFEILRYIVDRFPVMFTPPWVDTACQPISIRNILGYLQGCIEHPETRGQTFDIGGPEVLTYRQIIQLYAQQAGLAPRRIVPLFFLTPGISARLIHLVTPVPAAISVPLAEGLSVEVVCRENRIREIIPQPLYGCRETIRMAMQRLAQAQVDTCWSDAGALLPPEWISCGDAQYAGGTILECGHRVCIASNPETAWAPIERIGGETGWYFANRIWRWRGAIDKFIGGVGLRRGRRHPSRMQVGDSIDFWRVLALDSPRHVTLLAEMKMPGEAILDYRVAPAGDGNVTIEQLVRFFPRGLVGILYWFAGLAVHQWVFSGMLGAIAKATGARIISGPGQFTPTLPDTCRLPNQTGQRP